METNIFEQRAIKMCQNLDAKYDTLVEYKLNEEKEIMLSDYENPKKCRFCGKVSPQVTFRKVAHAISHMVENRFLKSDYECDTCNSVFATYESDYSAYMNLYHTVFQIPGKGGIPNFKNNSKTFSKIAPDNGNINISVKIDEDSLIEWEQEDKERNMIKIVGRRTYTPQNVLRTVIKMALSIMPKEEMLSFDSTIDWLMKKQGTVISGVIYPISIRLYRGKMPYTRCAIFRRKEGTTDQTPKYMFFLAYGNIAVQTGIPFVNEKDNIKGEVGTVPMVPCDLDFFQNWETMEITKFSSDEKIRGEIVKIPLHYDGVVEKDLTKERDSTNE